MCSSGFSARLFLPYSLVLYGHVVRGIFLGSALFYCVLIHEGLSRLFFQFLELGHLNVIMVCRYLEVPHATSYVTRPLHWHSYFCCCFHNYTYYIAMCLLPCVVPSAVDGLIGTRGGGFFKSEPGSTPRSLDWASAAFSLWDIPLPILVSSHLWVLVGRKTSSMSRKWPDQPSFTSLLALIVTLSVFHQKVPFLNTLLPTFQLPFMCGLLPLESFFVLSLCLAPSKHEGLLTSLDFTFECKMLIVSGVP